MEKSLFSKACWHIILLCLQKFLSLLLYFTHRLPPLENSNSSEPSPPSFTSNEAGKCKMLVFIRPFLWDWKPSGSVHKSSSAGKAAAQATGDRLEQNSIFLPAQLQSEGDVRTSLKAPQLFPRLIVAWSSPANADSYHCTREAVGEKVVMCLAGHTLILPLPDSHEIL